MQGPSCPMLISGRGQPSTPAWEYPLLWIPRERTCFRSHNGTSLSLESSRKRWKPQILEPATSIGFWDRNIPFREDIVESAVRTTVSVANCCPLVSPPLEMVDADELQSPSPETLPRVRLSIRNGVEHMETQWEVPNLSHWEPQPQNPTRYIEEGVLRHAPTVQNPQPMLVTRGECETQVQLRTDHNRLVAAPADPSYLTWQGAPHLLSQAPNHLSHDSDLYSSYTPDLWDNRQTGWVPCCEGLPRHFGGLSIFSGGDPLFPRKRSPLVCMEPLVEVQLVLLEVVLQVPW